MQADPLGMPDGPSRYAYVTNSPLMYIDPTGEQVLDAGLNAGSEFFKPNSAMSPMYEPYDRKNPQFAQQCITNLPPLLALGLAGKLFNESKGGKKAIDAGKNDAHGDGGRAQAKAQKQIEDLQKKLAETKGRREKKKIEDKIKKIRKAADKKRKGETHHR